LAHQEGAFVACFLVNVLMVHSPKPTVVTDSNRLIDVGFTLGKTIRFSSLDFITNCFGTLSLSPEGNDSDAMFVGMVHSGSPSLHTVLEESANEGNIASSGGGRASLSSEGATWSP
jgi:hypothetical protein